MTVSSTTNTNSYTTVNATTHSFAYGFKIFADGDLEVIVRSAAGTETVKTLDTHFIVTNAGIDAGGNVLFKYNTGTSSDAHFSATDYRPASGETVLLRRSLSLTQGTDYIENDTFSSNSHENALDRLTFITQSLEEELNRSFKVSKTNTIASAEFADSAATRASKTLGFDSDGNLTTIADFLPIGGDAAQFTYSTTTTDADPGSGFIRFNNTSLASASIAYVDDNEINGTDVSAWVLSFDDAAGGTNRGRLRMSKSNTLDTWAVWKVSGASTDASGYVKLALTYIDAAGTFANNDKIFLSFVASGETGATGGTSTLGIASGNSPVFTSGVADDDFLKVAGTTVEGRSAAEVASDISAKTVGKESIWVPAGAMYPSTTNGCSALTQVETTALRPDLKVLDFAAAADDFAQFSVAFPKSWNEGTITYQPFWTVTGTNAGTVVWQLGGIAVTSDATINTAFGTLVATTALAHSTTSNDLMVSAESGAVTIAGSPSTDDVCFFQINNDTSASGQTGAVRLLGIKIFFTTDAANDA